MEFIRSGCTTGADLAGREGQGRPVPMPLSETALTAMRAELTAAGTDHAGAPLVAVVGEDGVETLPDPLEGADLTALAKAQAVERGAHLYNVRLACKECHQADGGGGLVVDAQPVWTWYAPNITSGGKTKSYAAEDWDRLIRHGIKPDDTNATMPAIDYMALSDQELSDVIAYIQSLAPVETVQPETTLGPVGRVLLATGKMPIAAEEIDHAAAAVVAPPEPAATVEYGQHIAQVCVGCHRLAFEGGPIAAGPPDWPPAANLSRDDFKKEQGPVRDDPADRGASGWLGAGPRGDAVVAHRSVDGPRTRGGAHVPADPSGRPDRDLIRGVGVAQAAMGFHLMRLRVQVVGW